MTESVGRAPRARVAGIVVLLAGSAALGGAPHPVRASPAPAAIFQVGAAIRSVAPLDATMKTHVGGYGDCNGCPTTRVRQGDEFAVRAFYVSDGTTANVLVSAPAEGWFAGYQEGSDSAHPGGDRLGITDLRTEAAQRLKASADNPAGLPPSSPISGANLIVSTIHCHACPTLVGIWGPTNTTYLHYVYTQALGAILDAQRAARPAHLAWATADIGYVNDVTVGQANANEGWPVDGQLSILQARAVADNTVIGTYMNVPAHGNIVYGPDLREMNDEHFGAAAQWLERNVGGIGVVAAGTLGDQTTPMQGDNTRVKGDPRGSPDDKPGYPRAYDVIDRLGALTGSTAVEALLHHGHVISDGTLAAAEQLQPMPVTGPIALFLLFGDVVGSIPGVGPPLEGAVAQPADRSHLPPYTVAPESTILQVWFTALRIGDLAIASEPGEAFPHVTFAIRNQALSGAAAVFTPGNAQDQLGYYFEPYAFVPSVYYSADHYIFNIGVTLSTQNIQAHRLNGAALGFSGQLATDQYTDALNNDYLRYFLKAGVQVTAFPQGAAEHLDPAGGITLPIGVYRHQARGSETQCAPQVGILCTPGVPTAEVHTGPAILEVDGHPVSYAETKSGSYALVTFPCPGDYTLTATLPGTQAHWKDVVHVYSATMVTNSSFYEEGSRTGPHPLTAQNLSDLASSGARGCGGYKPAAAAAGARGNPGSQGGGLPNTSAGLAGAVKTAALILLTLGAAFAAARRLRARAP